MRLKTVRDIAPDHESEVRVLLDRDAYRAGLDVERTRVQRPTADGIAREIAAGDMADVPCHWAENSTGEPCADWSPVRACAACEIVHREIVGRS